MIFLKIYIEIVSLSRKRMKVGVFSKEGNFLFWVGWVGEIFIGNSYGIVCVGCLYGRVCLGRGILVLSLSII